MAVEDYMGLAIDGRHVSRAANIRGYEKSIVMGGGLTLFPLGSENIEALSEQLRNFTLLAERRAYKLGQEAAMRDMRKAIGL